MIPGENLFVFHEILWDHRSIPVTRKDEEAEGLPGGSRGEVRV